MIANIMSIANAKRARIPDDRVVSRHEWIRRLRG